MDDSQIFLENFEMLKALYDFKATFAKTLSFRESDLFILHQTNTKQRNWWHVINEKGEMGFIPSNYVQKIKVTPSFMLNFLETSTNCLRKDKHVSEADKLDLVARLDEKRRQIELNLQSIPQPDQIQSDLTSPADPTGHNEQRSLASYSSTSTDDHRPLPDLKYHKAKPQDAKAKSDHDLPDLKYKKSNQSHVGVLCDVQARDVYDIVETVRVNTKLSHEMSRVAVSTVLSQLQAILPENVTPHLSKMLVYSQTQLCAGDNIGSTHDASRLRVIFNELTYCKEDSQQRSWMLHEDETVIKEYISELISILSNADPSICKHVIANEQYLVVFTLVQYYQMEARWSIRQLLLQAFGVMCSLDKTVVNIMLNSVLPMELARDMRANPRNISKLNYSCLLLTMIFSMGDLMPVTHYEQLGYDFMLFILNAIEHPPDTDIDEQIPDLFLNFILSFNLQFQSYSESVVVKALDEQTTAKIFTEKILLLLNREEDPVRIFDHEPAPPHALLKLFNDMFCRKTTAQLFYTNDIRVLFDIIVRQLSDLSPGDKRRQQYLELCKRVMRNTNYDEHRHKLDDIRKCFTRIRCEEADTSVHDQQLVREITNELPQYFNM